MRELYPAIKPNFEKMLAVSDVHNLYYAEYGNPNGIPVVYCHGGPGAGTDHDEAQFHDPAQYRIILWHQRGSGKSTPLGEFADNNTQALVEDLEKLRKTLNIDRWVVAGGSWGSTLALVYAQTYPLSVMSLILRGVWLAREKDIYGFWNDDCPAAKANPEGWKEFKEQTTMIMQKAGIQESDFARDKDYHAYYDALMHHADPSIQMQAAEYYSRWETSVSFLKLDKSKLEWAATADGLNMGRMEAHYCKNKCFIAENFILNNLSKISHIPVYIVQGESDLVCPSYQAKELENALKQLGNNNVRLELVPAGHSMFETATIDGLVRASDDCLKNLLSDDHVAKLTMTRDFVSGSSSQNTTTAPTPAGTAVQTTTIPAASTTTSTGSYHPVL